MVYLLLLTVCKFGKDLNVFPACGWFLNQLNLYDHPSYSRILENVIPFLLAYSYLISFYRSYIGNELKPILSTPFLISFTDLLWGSFNLSSEYRVIKSIKTPTNLNHVHKFPFSPHNKNAFSWYVISHCSRRNISYCTGV